MMKGHDLPHLEGRIGALRQSLTQLSDDSDLAELLRHIHQPGWTTPAEFLLVAGMVDSLNKQVTLLIEQKQILMAGSRAVGAKQV